LSDRELQVVSLVCTGLKNKEIADRLFISESTVRHHLSSIFSKLGVTCRLDLIIYANRQGLVDLAAPEHPPSNLPHERTSSRPYQNWNGVRARSSPPVLV